MERKTKKEIRKKKQHLYRSIDNSLKANLEHINKTHTLFGIHALHLFNKVISDIF